MDEYKHCINCILARIGMMQFAIDMGDKKTADKAYEEVTKWFKDTYELKRKPKPQASPSARSDNKNLIQENAT